MRVCAAVVCVPLSVCYKVYMMKCFSSFSLASNLHMCLFAWEIISGLIF